MPPPAFGAGSVCIGKIDLFGFERKWTRCGRAAVKSTAARTPAAHVRCRLFARRATLHFKVQMARFGTFAVFHACMLCPRLVMRRSHTKNRHKLHHGCSLGVCSARCAAARAPLRRALGSLIFFFQAAGVDPKSFESASQLAMFFFNF